MPDEKPQAAVERAGTGGDDEIDAWLRRWLRAAHGWLRTSRLVFLCALVLLVSLLRNWRPTPPAERPTIFLACVAAAAAVGVAGAFVVRRRFRERMPEELERVCPVGDARRGTLLARLDLDRIARRDFGAARVLRARILANEVRVGTLGWHEGPFRSPAAEALFASVLGLVRAPSARSGPTAWLREWRVLLLVALVGWALAAMPTSARVLALELVGLVLLHELGHAVAMSAFGHRDPRVFLVPAFGAFVQGTADGAAAWERGVVLLMGPAPGIVLASAFIALRARVPETLAHPEFATLARLSLAWNLANLLPLAALDGGRIAQLTFLRRRPRMEYAAQALAALALAACADHLLRHGLTAAGWALAGIALVSLLGAQATLRAAPAARSLASRGLPRGELSSQPDDALRALFVAAGSARGWERIPRPSGLVRAMRAIHERATGDDLSRAQRFALAAAWLALAALALLALMAT